MAHRNQIQIELFIDSPANTTVGDITCIDRKVIVAHFLTAHRVALKKPFYFYASIQSLNLWLIYSHWYDFFLALVL